MGIPKLGKDGTLPRGVHRATLSDVWAAFGGKTAWRVVLMMALETAVKRAWNAGVTRILVDGSFVTAKKEPRDVDLVFRVDDEFARRLRRRDRDARWIAARAKEARPKTLDAFLAVDDAEWGSWERLFEQDVWTGWKSLVEVVK